VVQQNEVGAQEFLRVQRTVVGGIRFSANAKS